MTMTMTQDQNKLSQGFKISIICALLIYLGATVYIIYVYFIVSEKKDFTAITTMFVELIFGVASLLPRLKRI